MSLSQRDLAAHSAALPRHGALKNKRYHPKAQNLSDFPQLQEVGTFLHQFGQSSPSFPDVPILLGILCPIATVYSGKDSINSSVNMLKGEWFPARTLAQQPQRLLKSRSLLRQCPFLGLQHTAGTWHISAWHRGCTGPSIPSHGKPPAGLRLQRDELPLAKLEQF